MKRFVYGNSSTLFMIVVFQFQCPTGFGKITCLRYLRALCALVPYVLLYLTCFVPYDLLCLMYLVHCALSCLSASCPTCSRTSCPTCARASYSPCLTSPCALSVLVSQMSPPTYFLTCFMIQSQRLYSRVSMPQVTLLVFFYLMQLKLLQYAGNTWK